MFIFSHFDMILIIGAQVASSEIPAVCILHLFIMATCFFGGGCLGISGCGVEIARSQKFLPGASSSWQPVLGCMGSRVSVSFLVLT